MKKLFFPGEEHFVRDSSRPEPATKRSHRVILGERSKLYSPLKISYIQKILIHLKELLSPGFEYIFVQYKLKVFRLRASWT